MATAPEQDKPKTTRNRAKTESFDVFRAEVDGMFGAFTRIGSDIKVTGRGEAERRHLAIASVTEHYDEEEKVGTFATCLSGQFVTATRKRKVEPTDIWE